MDVLIIVGLGLVLIIIIVLWYAHQESLISGSGFSKFFDQSIANQQSRTVRDRFGMTKDDYLLDNAINQGSL